jgi:AmmeMemoRadiSam system protein A/AmmeMemoRadiSam system protein B
VYLLGPAHRVYTRGVAAPTVDWFASPLGRIAVDQERIRELAKRFEFVGWSDQSHAGEHSLEVHLPFLQAALDEFALVPLVVGDVDPRLLNTMLGAMLDDETGLVVVSSDLSHYHRYEEARHIDAGTVASMEDLNWRELGPERACGYVPVSALLMSAEERGLRVSAVDVRNSGDTAGPRDQVVGYASLVVHDSKNDLDAETRERLLGLARGAIDHHIDRRALSVDLRAWPSVCAHRRATFVTLTRGGRLRGCIGSLMPEEPLVSSVATNAVQAAFHDPRFEPLARVELDDLRVSISVLSPTEPMRFESERHLLEQLRPGTDGLILTCGQRRGTFLPSVWETLQTPRAFLAGLKRKASLPENFWSPEIRVDRYTTESFGEA